MPVNRKRSVITQITAFVVLIASSSAQAQTSQATGTLDVAQSQISLQGNGANCSGAATAPNSTAACPGNTNRTTSSQLRLTYRMADGTLRNECVWIDNASTKTYFVPLRTYREWTAFTSAASALNLQVTNCTTSASCGSAANTPVANAPTANLCSDSTNPAVSSNGSSWTWACGTNSCTAPISSVSCGSAANTPVENAPSANLCSDGTNPAVSSNGSNWTWTCGTNSCAAPISGTSCGSAANTSANYAPSANLCSDGTNPAVSPNSGNWTWTCGTNSCTAPITTPTLRAGCDVVLLMNPNGTGGEQPNDMRNANCGGFGYSSTDAIIMSVGTRLGSNLSVSGYQYWWDFGPDAGTNRFTIQWSGSLNRYMTAPNRFNPSARPVPNGSYTESVTVTDTYNGNRQTLSISANKETQPPICRTCAQQ